MQRINYDFSGLESAMIQLKNDQKNSTLNVIKSELNKFFKGSQCRDLIYTKNTDKPFFGMCVIPYISGDMAVKILTDDDKVMINQYYVELDSRLFDIYFTSKELTAMILHEVGHVVNDSLPAEEVRQSVDTYLQKNDENLTLSNSVQYKDILAFGMKEAIINLMSLFKKQDEEIIADQFVVLCGYGPDLESAYKKITTQVIRLNKGVPKLVALQWVLRIYKNVKMYRIGALHTINSAKKTLGSQLQKRELDNLARRLNQIDDHDLITEGFGSMISNIYKSFKYKGIRSLEDDLYEINLRVKNCDDKDEAFTLLRMINSRLSIIDDYIHTEKVDDKELDRWSGLMNKYRLVRDTLSKKSVYNAKSYGLFVQMPEIQENY